MSTAPRRPRKLDPADRIESAILNGLLEDKSKIDSAPVRRELAKRSKPGYDAMLELWDAYLTRFPGSDPRNMQDIKHFAETVGRSTKGRLDKELGKPTVKSIRNKMRRFMSAWERKYNVSIPKVIHDSVCEYIQKDLKRTIPLSIEERSPTFLTIDNYVHMHELHWQKDHHNYIHEGVRVYLAALLNIHCYAAARLQEICMAKYKDLLCMVAWKDREPDIKIGFKRDFAKGMQNTPKKPKHPLYERLHPTPPLFANSVLFLLSIFISAGAFREFKTVAEVLDAKPKAGEQFWIMDWEDEVLEVPVFPEIRVGGPIKKPKNPSSWGKQCSDWAMRAGFTTGMGLHAARREALIKVDDGGYSLGQVMKFAGHRNPKTLVGHYLDDMTNVDGAATFLDLEPRRDVTKDFRSASMRRNPDLQHSLPTRTLQELENRADYISLSEKIDALSSHIKTTVREEELKELKAQLDDLYYQRRKLREQELKRYQSSQRRAYKSQGNILDESDWRRTYFDRVVRHMVPERARLAQTLSLAAPLRSSQGISALQDLIALLTNDSRVAYQDVLQPIDGRCPVPTCAIDLERIALGDRWNHVYVCYKADLKKKHAFAKFCFLHSEWITSRAAWETHCQAHIDDMEIPFRCDPVTFRRGLACAGHCPGCLANTRLLASERMRHFKHLSNWKRHLSQCILNYINGLSGQGSIPCPHIGCAAALDSETSLWHHLGDYHSTHKPNIVTKRRSHLEESEDKEAQILGTAPKRRRLYTIAQGSTHTASASQEADIDHCPEGGTDYEFERYFRMGFSPKPTTVIETAPLSTVSASRCSSVHGSFWDGRENCPSTSTSLSSQTDRAFEEVNDYGENWLSPWAAESEPTVFSQSEDTEHDRLNEDSISSADLQLKDYSLSYPGMPPSLCIDPKETIDPMILSLDINSIDNSREILLASKAKSIGKENSQEAVEIGTGLPLKSVATTVDYRDGPQCESIGERLLPKPQPKEYAPVLHPQSRLTSPTETDECDEYEVEEILEARVYRGRLRYRVKWLGFEDDPEWYDASNFKNSPHKLRDFHTANPTRPGPPKRLYEWIQCWDEDRDVDEHPDDNKPERSRRRDRMS